MPQRTQQSRRPRGTTPGRCQSTRSTLSGRHGSCVVGTAARSSYRECLVVVASLSSCAIPHRPAPHSAQCSTASLMQYCIGGADVVACGCGRLVSGANFEKHRNTQRSKAVLLMRNASLTHRLAEGAAKRQVRLLWGRRKKHTQTRPYGPPSDPRQRKEASVCAAVLALSGGEAGELARGPAAQRVGKSVRSHECPTTDGAKALAWHTQYSPKSPGKRVRAGTNTHTQKRRPPACVAARAHVLVTQLLVRAQRAHARCEKLTRALAEAQGKETRSGVNAPAAGRTTQRGR